MKQILLMSFCAIALTACALFPQKYDANEFGLLTQFTVKIEKLHDSCGADGKITEELVVSLQNDLRVFELYVQYTPDDKEVYDVAKILRNDVDEFSAHIKRYGHNKAYCEIKSDLMHEKAITILKAVGDKPRG